MLKCVTIDDEPLARECIVDYISEVGFLQSVGTANNPIELTKLLKDQAVDLIFLDIQMPMINGIEFLKMTASRPMVIITTAYPSYALESFQLDVMDYLVKPITFDRFFKAVSKARDYHQLVNRPQTDTVNAPVADHFFIKCEYKYEKIYFDDVLYVQGLENYVTIHTRKGKYVTLLYLRNMEENLDPKLFIRVHKSFIVSIARIDAIENNDIIIQSTRIPISRNYRDSVMDRVISKNLWKKNGES